MYILQLDGGMTPMKRQIILNVLKVVGQAVIITLIAALIILIVGFLKHWQTSIQYSNAFFIAGSVLIIVGGLSKFSAAAGRAPPQNSPTETHPEPSPGEQSTQVVKPSSTSRLLAIGVISGFLCFIVSALITKIF